MSKILEGKIKILENKVKKLERKIKSERAYIDRIVSRLKWTNGLASSGFTSPGL